MASEEQETDLMSGQGVTIGGDSLESISFGSEDDKLDVESIFTSPAARLMTEDGTGLPVRGL